MTDRDLLPGEDAPLEMRFGGEPISPEEALGVARRWAKVAQAQGRRLTQMGLTDELPPPDAKLVSTTFRLPPRVLMFARAKAEMEGQTLTQVITEALQAYAASSPGAKVTYKPPRVP